MSTKLGLFVDSNSINWSLVEEKTNKLIDLGVHVFPPGCENFGMGKREVSKRYTRRLVRLRRIRYSRIRTRKYYLLKILIEHKMCPLSLEELEHWKKTKQYPTATLSEWIALNPYELRERGLHEKLTLEEFGKIFYQISCHRGYRFGERNSKLADNVLSLGIPADRKIGYLKTRRSIKDETLGSYLHSIKPADGETYTKPVERIRNRICTLEMFTHLHINDFFLLGLAEGVAIKTLSMETLFKHLYRVQKLSSKYYEFRSAHKQISNLFEFPDYIRINNFGDRKTGWKTYNPIKVKLSFTGKIQLE